MKRFNEINSTVKQTKVVVISILEQPEIDFFPKADVDFCKEELKFCEDLENKWLAAFEILNNNKYLYVRNNLRRYCVLHQKKRMEGRLTKAEKLEKAMLKKKLYPFMDKLNKSIQEKLAVILAAIEHLTSKK